MDEKQGLELNRFFTRPLSEFPSPAGGKVLTLKSDTPIHDAFCALFDRNYLSAPIENVDAPKGASWLDRFPNIIDMLDIVTFACNLAEQQKHEGDFTNFLSKIGDIQSMPIGTLAEKKNGEGFTPISEDSTVLDALLFLGKYHVRRLLVISHDPKVNDLTNIVTQSAMCKYLAETLKNPEFAAEMSSKTVEEVGLTKPRQLYSVDFRARVIDAFNIMSEHGIGAVPVIDKEGGMRLVGNVSARDVKLLLQEPDSLMHIYQPIYQFLASKNAEFDENVPEAMIVCHTTDSLQTVLLKLVGFRIHRIYLVDKKGTFQNIISLTDLLTVLVKEPK